MRNSKRSWGLAASLATSLSSTLHKKLVLETIECVKVKEGWSDQSFDGENSKDTIE